MAGSHTTKQPNAEETALEDYSQIIQQECVLPNALELKDCLLIRQLLPVFCSARQDTMVTPKLGSALHHVKIPLVDIY